jgi:hypothetical protein
MDDKAREGFLHGMAADLKAQADKARLELELFKIQIGKTLEPIEQQIKTLEAQKLLRYSEFEVELKEKEEAMRRKQDTHAHFAIAIGVSLSLY